MEELKTIKNKCKKKKIHTIHKIRNLKKLNLNQHKNIHLNIN